MRFAVFFKVKLIISALLLCSCVANNGVENNQPTGNSDAAISAPSQSAYGVIATDLVSSLIQLSELSPFSTTVQVNRPVTDFGKELVTAIRYSGYGVQIVPEDQGLHYLNYVTTRAVEEEETYYTFRIIVGDISVARTFIQRDGAYIPSSPIRIKGVGAQRIVVNDDIYRHTIGNAQFPSGVTFIDRNGQLVYYDARLVVSTNAMKRNNNDQIKTEMVLIHARANLFTKSRMTTKKKTQKYVPYKQVSLRFKPQSLDLGQKNKKAIQELLQSFNEDGDRFSITACSFGKSLIWDGTESVSLERGLRVRQELLASNISFENTRDESCFSTKYGDDLPRRTVLLTLERALRIL